MIKRATSHHLAFDLGAESGRAVIGHFDGQRLTLEEVHRFVTGPVRAGEHLYSDVLRLWSEMLVGLQKAAAHVHGGLASVGVDTWGVDFALLDNRDRLLSNPFHYRDPYTRQALAATLEHVPPDEIYAATGNQLVEFNTLFQLAALQQTGNPILGAAHSLLMLPDLFHFWLSGQKATEFTIATTSQCYNPLQCSWATPLLERLSLPTAIFQPIIAPGTVLGSLQPWLAEQGQNGKISVIVPASHDTASAVAAIPVNQPRFMYISSGTWSLVGVELDQPLITAETLAHNLANEGGVGGRTRLLKIIPGLWLLQQCRSEWARHGADYTYDDLMSMAATAPPFGPLLWVGAQELVTPGNIP
ncbi:MAG: rhamnulokinase, partial [Anaerolineae bacterium]|nr:rhamnulokinase [Anaerolineae bacterium]